jgi:hypothetical protein
MTVLTIDVGLKNLAMCIMECTNSKQLDTYSILLWNVYNTLDDEQPALCQSHLKNGNECNKKACLKYTKEKSVITTCKTHFPKDQTVTVRNKIKVKNVKDYLLQDITKIVLLKIAEIYNNNKEVFDKVDKILIELQPKVNNKMKLISHLIYGKFVELYLHTDVPIRFVSASKKLKAYKGPQLTCELKSSYAKRKYLSIQYTQWMLKNQFNQQQRDTWCNLLDTHSKKDDLCDVFLMGINALK